MSSDPSIRPATKPAVEFDLLPGGEIAFERILRCIDEARRSVWIRCFEWRDDETGRELARALLRAADRGVAITILKDRVGMHYEYLAASKQSFFHKKMGLLPRLQTWFLMAGYWRWGSLKQQPSPLADALTGHERIRVSYDQKRFDHAKLYVFDDERLILGGMGIGDEFRWTNVDFMVEISGAEAVQRLAERYEGREPFEPSRSFDYLLHSSQGGTQQEGSLAAQRLALIGNARERLTIEMAYLGDRACTDALVAAVNRGVAVTLLTSARASVVGDLNLYTCDQILKRTRNAANLRIVLHPRMVHGKAIVVDGEWVDIGSTNFTPLSHGGYEELDLYCRDAELARRVEAAIEDDVRDGTPARVAVEYRRVYAAVERLIVAYQSRAARKRQAAT